ncbi:MAG TPA: TlpA disulfide reductase family protein [Candidatus Limnocylindria bacterium]|nr:TlpA disulfide reductase family protein [Candidatus Limnocylindria bacterium]
MGLAAAVLVTFVLVQLRARLDGPVSSGSPASAIARGEPTPAIVGLTLDGAPFDLASLRGRPVLVNFWGPSCVPCRDEFPLFTTKLAEHAGDGLAIVGVLMGDPPAPARDFVAEYGATWPTVDDPEGEIRKAYRVAARPQTYFVDRDGILRSIQIGEVTDAEFERQYALISGAAATSGAAAGP